MNPERYTVIIPARAGSKGLPGKNKRVLAGKPMISHSIDAAKEIFSASQIFVNSDDLEILSLASKAGVGAIHRPDVLSGDQARMEDVVLHTLELRGGSRDHFVLLQPTSPLRTSAHIRAAMHLFDAGDYLSLVSVTPAEHHPFKMLIRAIDGFVPTRDYADLSAARQDLPEAFRQNGAIYICNVSAFLERKRFVIEPAAYFEMNGSISVDVDREEDFLACARALGTS